MQEASHLQWLGDKSPSLEEVGVCRLIDGQVERRDKTRSGDIGDKPYLDNIHLLPGAALERISSGRRC